MPSQRIIMNPMTPAALAVYASQAQVPRAAEDHHKRGLDPGQQGELDRARAVAPLDEQLSYGRRGCHQFLYPKAKVPEPAAVQIRFHKDAQKNSGWLSQFAMSFRLPG